MYDRDGWREKVREIRAGTQHDVDDKNIYEADSFHSFSKCNLMAEGFRFTYLAFGFS